MARLGIPGAVLIIAAGCGDDGWIGEPSKEAGASDVIVLDHGCVDTEPAKAALEEMDRELGTTLDHASSCVEQTLSLTSLVCDGVDDKGRKRSIWRLDGTRQGQWPTVMHDEAEENVTNLNHITGDDTHSGIGDTDGAEAADENLVMFAGNASCVMIKNHKAGEAGRSKQITDWQVNICPDPCNALIERTTQRMRALLDQ